MLTSSDCQILFYAFDSLTWDREVSSRATTSYCIISYRIISYHLVMYRIVLHYVNRHWIASLCISSYHIKFYCSLLCCNVLTVSYRITTNHKVKYRTSAKRPLSFWLCQSSGWETFNRERKGKGLGGSVRMIRGGRRSRRLCCSAGAACCSGDTDAEAGWRLGAHQEQRGESAVTGITGEIQPGSFWTAQDEEAQIRPVMCCSRLPSGFWLEPRCDVYVLMIYAAAVLQLIKRMLLTLVCVLPKGQNGMRGWSDARCVQNPYSPAADEKFPETDETRKIIINKEGKWGEKKQLQRLRSCRGSVV